MGNILKMEKRSKILGAMNRREAEINNVMSDRRERGSNPRSLGNCRSMRIMFMRK
jgi:hypothetical protein